jgi:predicted TIM-barrel fold metal-dependent hydrolase
MTDNQSPLADYRPPLPGLSFRPRTAVFDANVRVGNPHNEMAPFQNRAELLAEMDRLGVERALVYHAQAEAISPVDGNQMLEAWTGVDGRLLPQWSVMSSDESLAQIQALHQAGRVQSLRFYDTRSAGLPFRPWAHRPLLEWLSEHHIPLWIPLPDANADELAETLAAYPEIPVVLVGAHYTHALWLRPLMALHANIYLELSRLETLGEVESLCRAFGASRLLYGSWYPRYAMGPMLFYLHQTALSEAELALVCAGNLARLLHNTRSNEKG